MKHIDIRFKYVRDCPFWSFGLCCNLKTDRYECKDNKRSFPPKWCPLEDVVIRRCSTCRYHDLSFLKYPCKECGKTYENTTVVKDPSHWEQKKKE